LTITGKLGMADYPDHQHHDDADSRLVATMPPVARTLALVLAPALIDVISVALFRMHLPTQDCHGWNYKLWGTVPLYR
jgi:hypothetical protein